MTPQERCQSAEAGLEQARRMMADPRPERIEQCVEILGQVAGILENLAAGTSRDWDPAIHLALHRIQTGSRMLAMEIEQGANLVRGWMQRKFGAGYKPNGLPEFAEREHERVFEA